MPISFYSELPVFTSWWWLVKGIRFNSTLANKIWNDSYSRAGVCWSLLVKVYYYGERHTRIHALFSLLLKAVASRCNIWDCYCYFATSLGDSVKTWKDPGSLMTWLSRPHFRTFSDGWDILSFKAVWGLVWGFYLLPKVS